MTFLSQNVGDLVDKHRDANGCCGPKDFVVDGIIAMNDSVSDIVRRDSIRNS